MEIDEIVYAIDASTIDLALLVPHFVKLTSKKLNIPESSVSKSQLQNLKSYHWPGNIRELQNVLERAMIVSRGQSLRFDFPESGSRSKVIENSSIPASISSVNTNEILNESDLVELNRANIIRALKTCGGKVYGKDGAAALLELKPNTLASRMKKLGIVLREWTGLI